MAIVKVGTYRNPPVDITDYEAIVSHLEAYTRQVGNQGMILTEWTNITNAPKIAMGSYISHGGVLYVVKDEDYSLPSLSSDSRYYIRVAVSGETLALDCITDLTGYVWNAIYNGLYHPDGKQVLPYQIVKSGAVVEKWKITNLMQGSGFARVRYDGAVKCESLSVAGNANVGGALGVTGAVSGASINTGGLGAFLIGQNLRTTDSPTFAGLNINNAYGNNKCYPTRILSYSFPSSHATTQMPAMEIGMAACVAYSPYMEDADNALILPSGGVYAVIANASSNSGAGYGGIRRGGSVIWQNTATTGSTVTYYFYVVRVA